MMKCMHPEAQAVALSSLRWHSASDTRLVHPEIIRRLFPTASPSSSLKQRSRCVLAFSGCLPPAPRWRLPRPCARAALRGRRCVPDGPEREPKIARASHIPESARDYSVEATRSKNLVKSLSVHLLTQARVACRATSVRRSGFMTGKIVTSFVARPAVSAGRSVSTIVNSTFSKTADVEASKFGQHVFRGSVAEKYLKKQGESAKMLESSSWTEKKSDAMAAALLEWARDNGASSYCHWFQPMGSSGFRHGQSGQVMSCFPC